MTIVRRAARWLAVVGVACGIAAASTADAEEGRRILALPETWRFHPEAVATATPTDEEVEGWAEVRLPHTWNGRDGEDGGGYRRGAGWYRTTFQAPSNRHRLWLEFDGAALSADVYVNGRAVGRHEGGYARFRFDVTEALRPGLNTLDVRVDNSTTTTIAPLGGDFTVFGGLYRPVRLIETGPVHFDLADHGAAGAGVRASEVSSAAADLAFQARVVNDGDQPVRVRVRWRLVDRDGREATSAEAPFRARPGEAIEVSANRRLRSPRLWRGLLDPHLYTLEAVVLDDRGAPLDQVSLKTGVRDFRVDPDRGPLLNGEPAPMRGVNYFHAGRPGRGLAVQDWEIDQDFEIMAEMGATAVRLVHFQHPQRAYELADELGLMVWTEAPLNGAANASEAFSANLARQMRELIRQNRHHPSIVVWGLGNEVYSADDPADAAIALMQTVAHQEDSSLPTAYAHCCQDDLDRKALHADLTAYNRYFGWYENDFAHIGEWADERRARDPQRPLAISEFGAGASVLHQQLPPDRPRPDGEWHPEQYQTAFHQAYWRELRQRPWLWSTFIWVGFDLASDGREEGDRPGVNDKGLVTYDRSVRKDAWFWYQANWSATPMAHITDRRLGGRGPRTTVRAFSNLPALELWVNGRRVSEAVVADHEALWMDVRLDQGLNRAEIRVGEQLLDSAWLQP
ncbi:glycoside hydrolase family 2 protein [Brevundimonas sp.]|uniref:glycoside hydrolase family 2 protein n=1 Tax=Brevundimonas sp. TaxID=1871086 RepID=UPI002C2E2434|nr:glycoside hydrolase family 2 TIM barrel-domain containing protein [Brevundimonas sp.]HWQ85438.1 glycoside hydrolase family 2 TIM barrel-domain containing protein [Brevundimonas sp.]